VSIDPTLYCWDGTVLVDFFGSFNVLMALLSFTEIAMDSTTERTFVGYFGWKNNPNDTKIDLGCTGGLNDKLCNTFAYVFANGTIVLTILRSSFVDGLFA